LLCVALIPRECVQHDSDSGKEGDCAEQCKEREAESHGEREKGQAGTAVSGCPEEDCCALGLCGVQRPAPGEGVHEGTIHDRAGRRLGLVFAIQFAKWLREPLLVLRPIGRHANTLQRQLCLVTWKAAVI
ncbi:MAG: hypothetical protein WA476_10590, partial [Acidobacteriaceae bacterium]